MEDTKILQQKNDEVSALHAALEEINMRMAVAARVRTNEQQTENILKEMEAKNKALMDKIEYLQAAIEAAESSHSKEAFDSEIKWTEEIDRLEAVIAELKADHEFSNQRYEEEVLGLLNDNTNFKQEIRELSRVMEEDRLKIKAYEEEIAQLQRALGESSKSSLELQHSIASLSDSATKLEMDLNARANAKMAQIEREISHLQAELRMQSEKGEKAEATANKLKHDFEEKDAEFNVVLQDLIKSRLEFAQVSSDIDERIKIIGQLEQQIVEKNARIQELEGKNKKKKGLL